MILWDLTSRQHRLVAQAGGYFSALAFAPDVSTLAAAHVEFIPDEDLIYKKTGTTVRDVMLWSDWR